MPKMSRFAHLLGRRALAEDKDEREEDAEEEDEKKAKKSGKAKGRKAEDEKDDPDADEDDKDDPEAEDDDEDPEASEEDEQEKGADDGDSDDEAKSVKQGRHAERQRCARIFSSQYAGGNPLLAASLAFETGMSSAQAIRVMSSAGPAAAAAPVTSSRISLDQRMARVKNHHLGEDKKAADTSTPKGMAGQMSKLYNRAKGVK